MSRAVRTGLQAFSSPGCVFSSWGSWSSAPCRRVRGPALAVLVDDILGQVAARIALPEGVTGLNPRWKTVAAEGLGDAYRDIYAGLAMRYYTPGQVRVWA